MRHLLRTHRVSVNAIHEMVHRKDVAIIYEESHRQAADIYTKAFTVPDKWRAACELVSIFDSDFLKCVAIDPKDIGKVPDLVVPQQVELPEVQDIKGFPCRARGDMGFPALLLYREARGKLNFPAPYRH